jgi:hypothetical protein
MSSRIHHNSETDNSSELIRIGTKILKLLFVEEKLNLIQVHEVLCCLHDYSISEIERKEKQYSQECETKIIKIE